MKNKNFLYLILIAAILNGNTDAMQNKNQKESKQNKNLNEINFSDFNNFANLLLDSSPEDFKELFFQCKFKNIEQKIKILKLKLDKLENENDNKAIGLFYDTFKKLLLDSSAQDFMKLFSECKFKNIKQKIKILKLKLKPLRIISPNRTKPLLVKLIDLNNCDFIKTLLDHGANPLKSFPHLYRLTFREGDQKSKKETLILKEETALSYSIRYEKWDIVREILDKLYKKLLYKGKIDNFIKDLPKILKEKFPTTLINNIVYLLADETIAWLKTVDMNVDMNVDIVIRSGIPFLKDKLPEVFLLQKLFIKYIKIKKTIL